MFLSKLFFPDNIYCISCGNLIVDEDDYSLCRKCIDDIRWCEGRLCEKCGRMLAPENPKEYCRDCQSIEHIFEKGYACALYDEDVAEIIRGMKYKNNAHFAESISKLMESRFCAEADNNTGELPQYDLITCIPMNKNKKIIRGYDQAELIAINLAEKICIPYEKDLIQRVIDTPVMSNLGIEERNLNLKDAFVIKCDMINKIKNSKILIIDDVFTTGSTADACSAKLIDAGAKSVDLFVFAIGDDLRRNEK